MNTKSYVFACTLTLIIFINHTHSSPRNTVIASTNQVYLLEPKPYDIQVSHLVQRKHFDLALKIAVSGWGCLMMYGCTSVYSTQLLYLVTISIPCNCMYVYTLQFALPCDHISDMRNKSTNLVT